jgi:hypothetical protein
MPFDIKVHAQERILEVVYPPEPTAQEVAEYAVQMRATIDGMPSEWFALVDQRAVRAMSPDLVSTLTGLNAYAQMKGMALSARVVQSAPSGLQAWRMTRQAMLNIPARTFESREEALAWLKAPDHDLE